MNAFARWVSILCFAASAALLHAAKKPVQLHDVFAAPARFRPPSAIWRPDGLGFVYTDQGKLWFYDVATRHASAWATINDLEKPFPNQEDTRPVPFDWRNRRVDSSCPQWFPDGHS